MLLHAFGETARFTATDLPDPVAGPGEALVRIAATSVNPIEAKLRRNGGAIAPELPALLGSDLAGHIVAVGRNVQRFAPGDAVFGYAGGVRDDPGAYAQLVALDARLIAFAPRSIPLTHAAALPLAGLTAAEALERSAAGPGSSVMVLGATGGVGQLAVQMACAAGAIVHAGVRSPDKLDAARELGANTVFATQIESPVDHALRMSGGAGCDAVIDCTAGIDLETLFNALRDGGQLVSLVTRRACDLGLMSRKGLSLHSIFVPNSLRSTRARTSCGDRLEQITRLVDAGQLSPRIDPRMFTLEELNEAHAALERGCTNGKVLVLSEH